MESLDIQLVSLDSSQLGSWDGSGFYIFLNASMFDIRDKDFKPPPPKKNKKNGS